MSDSITLDTQQDGEATMTLIKSDNMGLDREQKIKSVLKQIQNLRKLEQDIARAESFSVPQTIVKKSKNLHQTPANKQKTQELLVEQSYLQQQVRDSGLRTLVEKERHLSNQLDSARLTVQNLEQHNKLLDQRNKYTHSNEDEAEAIELNRTLKKLKELLKNSTSDNHALTAQEKNNKQNNVKITECLDKLKEDYNLNDNDEQSTLEFTNKNSTNLAKNSSNNQADEKNIKKRSVFIESAADLISITKELLTKQESEIDLDYINILLIHKVISKNQTTSFNMMSNSSFMSSSRTGNNNLHSLKHNSISNNSKSTSQLNFSYRAINKKAQLLPRINSSKNTEIASKMEQYKHRRNRTNPVIVLSNYKDSKKSYSPDSKAMNQFETDSFLNNPIFRTGESSQVGKHSGIKLRSMRSSLVDGISLQQRSAVQMRLKIYPELNRKLSTVMSKITENSPREQDKAELTQLNFKFNDQVNVDDDGDLGKSLELASVKLNKRMSNKRASQSSYRISEWSVESKKDVNRKSTFYVQNPNIKTEPVAYSQNKLERFNNPEIIVTEVPNRLISPNGINRVNLDSKRDTLRDIESTRRKSTDEKNHKNEHSDRLRDQNKKDIVQVDIVNLRDQNKKDNVQVDIVNQDVVISTVKPNIQKQKVAEKQIVEDVIEKMENKDVRQVGQIQKINYLDQKKLLQDDKPGYQKVEIEQQQQKQQNDKILNKGDIILSNQKNIGIAGQKVTQKNVDLNSKPIIQQQVKSVVKLANKEENENFKQPVEQQYSLVETSPNFQPQIKLEKNSLDLHTSKVATKLIVETKPVEKSNDACQKIQNAETKPIALVEKNLTDLEAKKPTALEEKNLIDLEAKKQIVLVEKNLIDVEAKKQIVLVEKNLIVDKQPIIQPITKVEAEKEKPAEPATNKIIKPNSDLVKQQDLKPIVQPQAYSRTQLDSIPKLYPQKIEIIESRPQTPVQTNIQHIIQPDLTPKDDDINEETQKMSTITKKDEENHIKINIITSSPEIKQEHKPTLFNKQESPKNTNRDQTPQKNSPKIEKKKLEINNLDKINESANFQKNKKKSSIEPPVIQTLNTSNDNTEHIKNNNDNERINHELSNDTPDKILKIESSKSISRTSSKSSSLKSIKPVPINIQRSIKRQTSFISPVIAGDGSDIYVPIQQHRNSDIFNVPEFGNEDDSDFLRTFHSSIQVEEYSNNYKTIDSINDTGFRRDVTDDLIKEFITIGETDKQNTVNHKTYDDNELDQNSCITKINKITYVEYDLGIVYLCFHYLASDESTIKGLEMGEIKEGDKVIDFDIGNTDKFMTIYSSYKLDHISFLKMTTLDKFEVVSMGKDMITPKTTNIDISVQAYEYLGCVKTVFVQDEKIGRLKLGHIRWKVLQAKINDYQIIKDLIVVIMSY